MILVKLVLFPFKVVFKLLGFSVKTGYVIGRTPFRVTARTSRALGFKGFVLFCSGVIAGLLLAPFPGRELRSRVRTLIRGAESVPDDELAEKVGFELSHAPRTWHLPQPEVAVVAGRVELRGSVPHDTGREELERVAAAVPGVAGVDNKLVIEGNGGATSEAGEGGASSN